MQFGWTAAFWWMALAAPIVLFYILKVRLRRIPVSTTYFWEQVYHEKNPRSIWQKLRHLLSLLLQLLFLLLVVLALADPYLLGDWMKPRRVVLIVDQSASMQAADVKTTRLDVAKGQASKMIDALRWRDDMAIISAGSVPTVEIGLTSHQRTLRKTLDGIEPTDGTGSTHEAVDIARRLIADHPNAEIHLLTDQELDESLGDETQEFVKVHRVGESTDNIGITNFQVRRSIIDPIGFQILVEVSNFSESDVECRLNIDLGEDVVDVVPLKLTPGEVWSDVLDHATALGGELVATIDREDILAVDNTARALLPKREMQPVFLSSDTNLFLRTVFEAIPYVQVQRGSGETTASPVEAVSVYYRDVPQELPDGSVIVIDPQQDTSLFAIGETLENPLVVEQDSESELMTHVKLQNVNFPGARKLELKEGAQVLVKSLDGDPLYASIEHENGKVLVLTVNLDEGDLPLRTAFPIMISNALSWFQGEKGEWNEAYATGEIITFPLEENDDEQTELLFISPGGREFPIPGQLEETTLGPLEEAGIWKLVERTPAAEEDGEPQDVVVNQFACNLDSPEESRLLQDVASREEAVLLAAGMGSRPIWFYLSALALLMICTEWYLYQRRWIS
jgi:hypothetical protein